ncbi:unnamed protein product [Brassicogethes aeneus]|uniref:Glucose-methanol-choline oxidoreductase N-terminal domain-containing protein n=1 Tax=Brassicogethes aeneus TaxID=1431903 RepID=A0A9P0FC70_BRAAE|nr:unnamed protein product [Brassicogethes aeneus]
MENIATGSWRLSQRFHGFTCKRITFQIYTLQLGIQDCTTKLFLLRYWIFKSFNKSMLICNIFPGMNNEECLCPRGQGLGGTTLINGLMYARGHKIDFDKWAAMGNPGWAYKEVLPLFKKSEGMLKNNPDAVVDWAFHNPSGPLRVEYKPTTDPQLKAWYEAQQSFGYQFADPNSPQQIGFGPVPGNIKHGRRQDGGTVFVLPVLTRENLVVQTNTLVTKIVFREGWFVKPIAKGVEFAFNGTYYTAWAKKEVIVSGGSINTPQLLMISGIGPKRHLKEKDVRVIKDLPVGLTLREHPAFFGLLFSSNYSEPVKSFNEYIKEYLQGTGPLTITGGFRGMSFYKTKYETVPKYPDLEVLFASGNCTSQFVQKGFNWKDETYRAAFAPLNPRKCFQATPIALHSQSVGYVKLKTNSPYDFPLINPNHLSDRKKRDINTLYEGIQMIIKFTKTEAMQKFNATIGVTPLPACTQHEFLSRDYWFCALGQMTYNIYHPVGTCPMGPNPKKSVVNHELKVHGVNNLRVADASVFPFTLSGHPNAPCVMIGEKLALLLKRDYL